VGPEPWYITNDPPPWLDATISEVGQIRTWAIKLKIREAWFSATSRTLTADGVFETVQKDERVTDALLRLLRAEDDKQIKEREAARDRWTEAWQAVRRRFKGKPGE